MRNGGADGNPFGAKADTFAPPVTIGDVQKTMIGRQDVRLVGKRLLAVIKRRHESNQENVAVVVLERAE